MINKIDKEIYNTIQGILTITGNSKKRLDVERMAENNNKLWELNDKLVNLVFGASEIAIVKHSITESFIEWFIVNIENLKENYTKKLRYYANELEKVITQ